jgi:hypothetical protein
VTIAGVDYDSFGVYVALLPFSEEWDGLPHAPGPQYVELLYRKRHGREAAGDFTFEAAKRIPELIYERVPIPSLVFVERGFAKPGQQKHLFAMGRVQGLVVGSFLRMSVPVAVNELTTAEWKIGAGAKGNAPKAVAHAALAERFAGELPDEENMRDAVAIAYAGRALNRKASAA